MKLNKIELTQNNTIQIQEIIEHGEGDLTAKSLHRRTTDSRQDLTGEHDFIKQAAANFPFIEDAEETRPDGLHEDIGFMRLTMSDLTKFRYDVSIIKIADGEIVSRERKPPVLVSMLDDVSSLPQKVQEVAALMFIPEARTAYIAALPRVEVPVKTSVQEMYKVARTKTIRVPAVFEADVMIEEEKVIEVPDTVKATRTIKATSEIQIIDGKAITVEIPESIEEYDKPLYDEYPLFNVDGSPKMIEVETGETTTMIEYKGELHETIT